MLQKYSEAATGGVLYKKVFLKISRNSQENNCARVSFLIKLQASGGCFCSFPQKINTIVPLCSAYLSRNRTFFFQGSIVQFRPFHDGFASSRHKVTFICSDTIFFEGSMFIQNIQKMLRKCRYSILHKSQSSFLNELLRKLL